MTGLYRGAVSRIGVQAIPLLILFALVFCLSVNDRFGFSGVIDLFNSGQDAHHSTGIWTTPSNSIPRHIALNPNIYQIQYQLGIALMALTDRRTPSLL